MVFGLFQFFSIILSKSIKKKIIIHPHGMLLKEAVQSDNKIKFILKFGLSYLKGLLIQILFCINY